MRSLPSREKPPDMQGHSARHKVVLVLCSCSCNVVSQLPAGTVGEHQRPASPAVAVMQNHRGKMLRSDPDGNVRGHGEDDGGTYPSRTPLLSLPHQSMIRSPRLTRKRWSRSPDDTSMSQLTRRRKMLPSGDAGKLGLPHFFFQTRLAVTTGFYVV